MKKWLVILLSLAFVWFPAFAQEVEEELTADTMLYIESDGMVQIMTAGEVWTNLETQEADLQVTHGAYYLSEDHFYVPMSLADQQSLNSQTEMEAMPLTALGESRGNDINVGYQNEWGIKSTFSAYIDALISVSGDLASRAFEAHLYAGGYLFTKNIKVVEFDANMRNNGTSPTASTSFKLFGTTVFNTGELKLSLEKSWNKEWSATKRFMIGPIPVSVSGTIGGTLGFKAYIGLTEEGLGIQGVAIPWLNTYGKCEAAVDIWIAKAGVRGEIVFVDNKLIISAGVAFIPVAKVVELSLAVDDELKALAGKIDIFAAIRKPWGGWKEWTWNLFTWGGIVKTWNLVDLTKTIEF